MSKILVIRFSALGDVAMTIPVIYSFAVQYPQHQVSVLSREAFRPLFSGLPENVSFVSADFKGEHRGIKGLFRLSQQLKAMKFDAIADLHDVLRSQFIRLCFRFQGLTIAHILKGREGKKQLISKHHKVLKEQVSSFARYQDVFARLGYSFPLNFTSIYGVGQGNLSLIKQYTGTKDEVKWIGIAPFSKHEGKIYPLELQEQIVAHFAADKQVKVFLFGGGKVEEQTFDAWKEKYPSIVSMIGKLNLSTELILISHLDAMISMDSANMHLASLVGTPVVSVWGATHPYCGFMGWKQSLDNAVQIDLACRPCSIYGQKPCFRGDYACLWEIKPKQVIEKVEEVIKQGNK
ncbi:MAG: glycosyltransferase family 9 protein [Bacteroides sp.]